MNYRNLILALSLLLPLGCFAQTIVTGTVTDQNGHPVANGSVTIEKQNPVLIIAFGRTDEAGNFQITIKPGAPDSLTLRIRHLSYAESLKKILNRPAKYSFVVQPQNNILTEVKVAAPPIVRRKDTINFLVDAFTAKQDRVIGDVIKKMPGIEMKGNQILYQGKPIQQYLINGLDLLENRYGLANNNLPVDAVKRVQVLENHQPIKMLDTLVFSDRASLNIQLKKSTTTGTGRVGGGAAPALGDVSLTPMTFYPNFQTLNTLQLNNIGNNAPEQLSNFGSNNYTMAGMLFNFHDAGNDLSNVFNIRAVTPPAFEQKRWLDNRTGIISSNFLKKLSADLEVKGSATYINDYQQRSGTTITVQLTPGRTVNIAESVDNHYRINELGGNFTVLKNASNVYLKNNFRYSNRWTEDEGGVIRNGIDPTTQYARQTALKLSNTLTATKIISKMIFSVGSNTEYNRAAQSVTITPGQFAGLFGAGTRYPEIVQKVRPENFSTENFISFIKPSGYFTIIPRVGALLAVQQFNSNLYGGTAASQQDLGAAFTNTTKLTTVQPYADSKIQYQTRKWIAEFNTPLIWRNYQANGGSLLGSNKDSSILTFEPRGFIKYKPSYALAFTLSSGLSNNFGGIQSVYDAYVFTSYRTVQRFNGMMPRSKSWTSSFAITSDRADQNRFWDVGYTYTKQNRDYIYQNFIDSSGFNRIELVARDNSLNSQQVRASFGEYLGGIKTLIKLFANASFATTNNLFAGQLGTTHSSTYSGLFNLNNTFFSFMSFSYSGQVSFTRYRLQGGNTQQFSTINHLTEVNAFPFENHTASLNCDYYNTFYTNRTQNTLFIDLKYGIIFPKRKIEAVLSCINLLNKAAFTQVFNSEFSTVNSQYILRPRQFLLAVKFKF